MRYRFRQIRNRLRVFMARERQRGRGLFRAILLDLPRILAAKAYAKLARYVNGRVLTPLVNKPRLRTFQRRYEHQIGDHFYLIVMPGTLHFLLPSLALLPADLKLLLLFNGAKKWEERILKGKWPCLPSLRLATLPGSSVTHGDVLTLLLKENKQNFGILDHDLYLFDKRIFDQLQLKDDECMRGIYGGRSATGFDYPHTCFLFLNTARLRKLMDRYGVDARLYRKAPARLQARLDSIGLIKGVYLKNYHNYFDTLHLLLAIAFSEHMRVGFIQLEDENGVFHVGGTSIGSYRTTDLVQLYIRQQFLELTDDDELRKHYVYLVDEFPNLAELRRKLPRTPEVAQMLRVLDALIRRLKHLAIPYIVGPPIS